MSDLNELAKKQNREALLLAEVAAWLHDDFKHTDQHIFKKINGAPKPSGRQDVEDLISTRTVSLLGNTIPFSQVRKRRKTDFVKYYLNRCHYTAHIEKQDGDDLLQSYPSFLSSPFGFECDIFKTPPELTKDLRSRVSWTSLNNSPFTGIYQDNLRREICELFSRVGGDTRRPANEITLWEWGHTVGAFYKAALAGALLGFEPLANDLRWRLLSIRFDGFTFFAQSARLPDLLARRNLLVDVLDEIRNLLETTYPIGTEVYRDENGSVFVVPGCEKDKCTLDLLALQDGGKTLRKHILDKAWEILDGELVPDICLDREPWYGQDPERRQGKDDLPNISKHLKLVVTAPDSSWVQKQWNNEEEQICTVCVLRPQGYCAPDRSEHYRHKAQGEKYLKECQTCKAISRGICSICEQRRADRSQEWATEKLRTTIWIDEVADANARIALIMGRFDLTHWLSSELVKTLAARNPIHSTNKTPDEVAKNPSFARLRRVWETTHRFWQDVFPTGDGGDLAQSLVGQNIGQTGPRLEVRGTLQSWQADDTLGRYHAYDLAFSQGVKMSVVWDPDHNRFITGDNLAYLASNGQLGQNIKDLLKEGVTLNIEELVGYGAKNKVSGKITLTSNAAEILGSKYIPAISILAEPLTFMALVPADKALQVVDAIRIKYDKEMAKVRNRLPLHLGIVYAHRRTPLRAVLDAGRRMREQKALGEVGAWVVLDDVIERDDPLPTRAVKALGEGTSQFKRWSVVRLKHLGINRELTWLVPAVMGDGETVDNWYPYAFWIKDKDGNMEPAKATDPRSRYFQAPDDSGILRPGWLVHAGELKKDDQICFTPATMDFQWLDSAGRRFEIAYESKDDSRGQRHDLPHRPYLLDELESLQNIWETLKHHLSKTQIHALRDLIEAKREEWQVITLKLAEFDPQGKPIRSDDVFWQFCYDTLANAEWRGGKMPWQVGSKDRDIWLAQWANHAARGWLSDVVELYLQIMKEEI